MAAQKLRDAGLGADVVLRDLMPPRVPAVSRKKSTVDLSDAAVDQRKAEAHAMEHPAPRFRLLGAADFDTLPKLEWRIHGVLSTMAAGSIFGPKGSAKSFLMLDMVAALGTGDRWFGYRVKACRVVVVVLEGEAGFRRRVEAWERFNERAFPDNVRFVFQSFELMLADDVVDLAAAINADGDADVIVIDTLNRAAPGADENGPQDMGRIIKGTKDLQAFTGAAVVLVHHSGKNALAGMRGHSSLGGALDLCIEVSHVGDRREWKLEKNKDGEDGAVHGFRLQTVELGADDEGEPIRSCVVRPDDESEPAAPRPKVPQGRNQKIIFDALGPLFRESTRRGMAGAPQVRPCLDLENAIVKTRDRLTCEADRRTERARQAITGLVSGGILSHNEGWIWIT